MIKQKNVLGKMYASEMKVELALIDQVKAAIAKAGTLDEKVNSIYSNADQTNKLFQEAAKRKEAIAKEYANNRKLSDDLLKELFDQFKVISASAKEIGVDVNAMPIYKEYLAAQDKLKAGRDKNQTAWELVSKF